MSVDETEYETAEGGPYVCVCKPGEIGPDSSIIVRGEKAESLPMAALIADAFNTAHDTGRTPSELAAMVDRVRGIVADWNYCEDEPRASAFRLHDALIDALLAELDAKTKEG